MLRDAAKTLAKRALLANPWLLIAVTIIALIGVLVIAAVAITTGAALLQSGGCGANGQLGGPGPASVQQIPSSLLPVFEAASARFRLGNDGWAYLAGIMDDESSFGRSTASGVTSGSNSAGAAGPMQMGIGVISSANGGAGDAWDQYRAQIPPNLPGGAQPPSVYNAVDAVYAAAAKLRHDGAPGDWMGALRAWNNYAPELQKVISDVALFTHSGTGQGTSVFVSAQTACAAPGQYVDPFGRTPNPAISRIDMGVDVDGHGAILALGDGQVLTAQTDIGGGWTCGASSANGGVVYRLSDGPDAGKLVYVAEDIVPTVHVGDLIAAGQQVAAFEGSNCIETGWAAYVAGCRSVCPYAASNGGGFDGSSPTAAGDNFYDLLHSLGLPADSISIANRAAPPEGHYP